MKPTSSLAIQYESRLAAGQLRPDRAQAEAAAILQELADRLQGYKPAVARGAIGKFLREPQEAPKGLYLYGDVGRGKSMLMDMFYEAANVGKKRRVHFHQFMLEVHERLHRLQTGPEEAQGILPRLARDIASEAWLLCFDEFHVSNIADAMILSRLFQGLFEAGSVVVATSNWSPDDLYKNGLQRERFLSFIDLIKRRMDVHRLQGDTDHRYEQLRGTQAYFSPLGAVSTARLNAIFTQATASAAPAPMQLPVQGRIVAVPRAAKGVAFFSFAELCEKPLGSADYIAIAECFHTVLIDGVPQFSEERRNEAVRFTTLIDALYEAKVKLFMATAVAPERLCISGEHAFAFQRTVSRLAEMQGEEYRQKGHLA